MLFSLSEMRSKQFRACSAVSLFSPISDSVSNGVLDVLGAVDGQLTERELNALRREERIAAIVLGFGEAVSVTPTRTDAA